MNAPKSDRLGRLCKRCYRNYSKDIICPTCKNELIALYEGKLTWKTAFEVERISKRAMRYAGNSDDQDGD